MDEKTINQGAVRLLDEAAFTSSKVSRKERESGNVGEENMYPASKAETDRMAELLRQAQSAADDPQEAEFQEKYEVLDGIVKWSYGRYRTWNWGLVIGVVLFALLLLWGRNSNQNKAEKYKGYAAQVEAWTPCDTTITWEKSGVEGYTYDVTFANANNWKRAELAYAKNNYNSYLKTADGYSKNTDTASTQESKEKYLNLRQGSLDKADGCRHRFDSIAALDFEGVQHMAKKQAEGWSKGSTKDTYFFLVNMILLIILIVLYIWTGYSYGYDLTRHRTRNKVLGWVRKTGFWLAGLCFGTGLAMQLFAPDRQVEYIYSSGRRETRSEADVAGTSMNIVFKIGLMFIGAAIFIFVSTVLMFIETVAGVAGKIRSARSTKAGEVEEPKAE